MRPAQLLTILDLEFTSTREGHHTPVMVCSINPLSARRSLRSGA